ncbi:MAG: aminopeptidase P [uncultured bacterium]|nr:MAG: aminopeptidase P [uncultured bacterium]
MNKIAQLRKGMEKLGLGAFLVTKRENVRWLTGFTADDPSTVLITQKRKFFFVYISSLEQAKEQARGFKVIDISKDGKEKIERIFSKVNTKYVGFENSIPFNLLKRFKKLDKRNGRRWKATRMILEELRMIKTNDEIRNVRKACGLAEEGFVYIKRKLKFGITEKEIEWDLEKYMRDRGADERSFKFVIGFGPNSARGHHESNKRKLCKGDFVLLDFGVKVEGFASDITRTVFFGKPTARQAEIYDTVLNAQKEVFKNLKIEMKASELHKIAERYIKKAGKGYELLHGLGHGLGLEIHELPIIADKKKLKWKIKDFVIAPNMVFTIEPGIYFPGYGGVRIEDDIVMTKRGYEILTKSPKELKDIIIK